MRDPIARFCRRLIEALLLCAPLLASGAGEAPKLKEWLVPWPDTRPRDPYVDTSGRVWFVGQQGHYVAWLDPESGKFGRHALPDGTGPHNLIVQGADTIWYAGNRAAHIGRMDAQTGSIDKIAMPRPEARDPHTLVFGEEGNIWFTVQGGNFVGRLTTASGGAAANASNVELLEVPTPNSRPYGIVVAPSGTVWVTEFGSNKLGRVDPMSMALTEVELPRAGARPRRLGATSDGHIWYVDYAEGHLGRYEPETGRFEEWLTPSGAGSRPYGMAVDRNDRIWLVETGVQPNRFIGFDAHTERFLAGADVESGGGTVRHMFYHEPTHSVWFGADTNTIGRARLPD